MSTFVHPSAVVHPHARLAEGVQVGPYCVVAEDVELGAGTQLLAHATVLGPTRLGQRCVVFPYTTLGAPPQDRTFTGERTRLEVGDESTFREQVTVHRGTSKGGGLTRVGSRCLLMVGAHVAHDCQVGDDVVLTNLTALGGHVQAESNVVCGGLVAVAPFVRLGRGCFLAGGAMVEGDVPPFLIAAGDRARVRGVNRVGLRRMQVPEVSRRALQAAYRAIWRSGEPVVRGMRSAAERFGSDPYVRELLEFLSLRHAAQSLR